MFLGSSAIFNVLFPFQRYMEGTLGLFVPCHNVNIFMLPFWLFTSLHTHTLALIIEFSVSQMPGQTLCSQGLMDSSDLYNVKNYSMCLWPAHTNVTNPITVTSKVTLHIPTMQCGGWHFPSTSSRQRQVASGLLSFLFHSQTAKKTSAVKSSPVFPISAYSFCGY